MSSENVRPISQRKCPRQLFGRSVNGASPKSTHWTKSTIVTLRVPFDPVMRPRTLSPKRITFQHTFPLLRKGSTGPKKTKAARKKPPTKPSAAKEPPTDKPKKPKPPKQGRREYDRIRNQRPERMEYRRSYAREKRKKVKALGLCKSCSNTSIPGQARCPSCAERHRESRRRSDVKRQDIAPVKRRQRTNRGHQSRRDGNNPSGPSRPPARTNGASSPPTCSRGP